MPSRRSGCFSDPKRFFDSHCLYGVPPVPHQLIAGLRYVFPKTMKRLEPKHPGLVALHDKVAARPNIAAYRVSERRIPFNQDDIFRNYPELDT